MTRSQPTGAAGAVGNDSKPTDRHGMGSRHCSNVRGRSGQQILKASHAGGACSVAVGRPYLMSAVLGLAYEAAQVADGAPALLPQLGRHSPMHGGGLGAAEELSD